MDVKSLHEKALGLARTYRESESALLDVLIDLQKRNGFFELSYPSLFIYCTSALKLSEAQACYFSKVAKKSQEVPQLKQAIENGILSLSQARRVVPVITVANSQDWIDKAATLPQRELEREVCAVNPKAMPRENVRIVSKDRAELKVGISKTLETKLRRIREIVGPSKTLEETLEQMADFYLKHKDSVQKAERVIAKKILEPLSSGNSRHRPSSRKLTAGVRHEVNLRDQGRCRALLPNGEPCSSAAWTHHHHIEPKAQGGPNLPSNLITLCAAHHRLTHQTGLKNLRV